MYLDDADAAIWIEHDLSDPTKTPIPTSGLLEGFHNSLGNDQWPPATYVCVFPCEFIYSFPSLSGFLLFPPPPQTHHRRDQAYFISSYRSLMIATAVDATNPSRRFSFFWYGSLAVSSMFRDSYPISVVIQPPSFGFLSSTSYLTSAPLLEYSWNASCNLSISHFTPSVKLTVVPTALVHWWILKKVVSRAQVFSSVSLPIRLSITWCPFFFIHRVPLNRYSP